MLLLVPFLAACGTRKVVSIATSSHERKDSDRIETSIAHSATINDHHAAEWYEELIELTLLELDTAVGKPRPRFTAAQRHIKRSGRSDRHITTQTDTSATQAALVTKVDREAKSIAKMRTRRSPIFQLIDIAFGGLMLFPLALGGIVLWRYRSKWLSLLKTCFTSNKHSL